jgi:hypothetical protein
VSGSTNCAFWIFAKVLDYTCVGNSLDFEKARRAREIEPKPALRSCARVPEVGTGFDFNHDFSAILRFTRAARG